jgi:hypothetical protein
MHPPSFASRQLAWLGFVASAALVALAIVLGLETPWLGAGLATAALLVLARRALLRRRMRRLLISGNLGLVLQIWSDPLSRVPHAETMRPLVVATLLVAHGMLDKARQVLGSARRGDAWEAALEHRLMIQTLMDAFEGERQRALNAATRLVDLPILPSSPWMRARVASLRSAVLAFARSFAHQAEDKDIAKLTRAAGQNPLVHWPMRYAAAVAYLDHGQPTKARELLASAPDWPEDSVFHHFHRELVERW